MVEFDSVFDENITEALNRASMKKLWWLYAVVSLAFIALGIVSLLDKDEAGIVWIVFGILFFPFTLFLTKIMQKNINRSMNLLSTETKEYYRFEEQKFVVRQNKGTDYLAATEAAYSYLYKVIESKDCYFLYLSKAQAHVVFKSGLISGSLAELNAILARNLGSRFKAQK